MPNNKIVLGSGKLFVAEATGSAGNYTIPSDATLETDANIIGWIQGGATLEYTPEYYEAKDDLGKVSKKFVTDEEAILRSGIMTWNADTLEKITSTASEVTTVPATTSSAGKKTIKLGGIGRYSNKQYVIRFLYEDKTDGDVRVTIVGSNESGMEISFAKDAETVINAEFKAVPNDSDGTLIIFEETLPQLDA